MLKLSMSLKHLKLTYLKNCQKSTLKNYLMTQNTLLNNSIFFKFQKNKIAFNFSTNKDNNNKEYQSQFMSTQNKKQQNQQNKKDSFQQEKNSNNKKKQSENTQKDEIFPNMNYYEILGFQKNIVNPTQEEIKAAYLDAVKKYHPDLSNDKLAVQKFQIIQKVYEVLSDPQKRSQYRASLKLPVQQGQTYEAAKRFKQQFKNYDKIIKQRAPDQWQFSYKLYKQHYEKLQVAKKNYKKYHGQDKQYWVSNDQIPIRPKAVIQAVSMIAVSVFIGSCAFYYIWN